MRKSICLNRKSEGEYFYYEIKLCYFDIDCKMIFEMDKKLTNIFCKFYVNRKSNYLIDAESINPTSVYSNNLSRFEKSHNRQVVEHHLPMV